MLPNTNNKHTHIGLHPCLLGGAGPLFGCQLSLCAPLSSGVLARHQLVGELPQQHRETAPNWAGSVMSGDGWLVLGQVLWVCLLAVPLAGGLLGAGSREQQSLKERQRRMCVACVQGCDCVWMMMMW